MNVAYAGLDPVYHFGEMCSYTHKPRELLKVIFEDCDFDELSDLDILNCDYDKLEQFHARFHELQDEYDNVVANKSMSFEAKEWELEGLYNEVIELLNTILMPGMYIGNHYGFGIWFRDRVDCLLTDLLSRGFIQKPSRLDSVWYDCYLRNAHVKVRIYLALVEMIEFLRYRNEWNIGTCDMDITELDPDDIDFGYGLYNDKVNDAMSKYSFSKHEAEEFIKSRYWIYPYDIYCDILIKKKETTKEADN